MDEFASREYPIREDMRFQGRFWRWERVAWLILILLAAAGLTGVLGVGPLSWVKASAGPLTVEYERFQRVTRLVKFSFSISEHSASDLRLHLNADFQKNFEISSIQPRPSRSAGGADGIDLIFAGEPGREARIVIWAHSRHYGLSHLTASADGGETANFWVMVYP
jgi:hypothetical protein